jgi:hypothetical protein
MLRKVRRRTIRMLGLWESLMRHVPLIISLALLAACASMPQADSSFIDAQRMFDVQPRTDATDAYRTAWAEFNNAYGLDERDGCYRKANGPLVQIFQIDASGKIIGYFADRQNGRSRCWRQTYLGVTFPKPPFAPFLHRLKMQ